MGRSLIHQNPERASAYMIDLLCSAAGIDQSYVKSITCKAEGGKLLEFTIVKMGEPDVVLKAIEGAGKREGGAIPQ